MTDSDVPSEGVLPDSVPLEELARELAMRGPEAFRQEHKNPFLLLARGPEEAPEVVTPRTDEIMNGDIQAVHDLPIRYVPEMRALEVNKSRRNAFHSKITVGRAKNNDIIIRAPEISKLHAVFVRQEDKTWRLKDMDSANGTMVNGTKLGKSESIEVQSGDQITFPEGQLKDRDKIAFCRFTFEFMSVDSLMELLLKIR
jgi:pSer/pThr/pTyr-binding forkhead associated (FHA) protein